MLYFSISSTSTHIIELMVSFFIVSYIDSLFFFDNCLLSFSIDKFSINFLDLFGKYTAAANTPPAAGPRPASSVPITVSEKLLSNLNSSSMCAIIINPK